MLRLARAGDGRVSDDVVECGYRAVSLRWSKLPRACVELARARGLAVFVWTLNASAELEAALEMGVLRPLEDHLFRWKKEAENQ